MSFRLNLNRCMDEVARRCYANDREFKRRGWSRPDSVGDEPADYLVLTPDDAHDPESVFRKLRWGGHLVFLAEKNADLLRILNTYRSGVGFNIDYGPAACKLGKLPFFSKKFYYFIARRVDLTYPGELSFRFTFDVKLVRHESSNYDYAVLKQIPAREHVVRRLREKFPNEDGKFLHNHARKLVDHVFPVFLTREVAFLRLLERDLPEAYQARVPRVLGVEKNEKGMANKMLMSWLRQGDNELGQLEFARQASDLLTLIHEKAKIIHLDLRLDNTLITRDGVCIIDFGSAVRVGEKFRDESMLRTLFGEMMSTSQVQQTMGKMIELGQITSMDMINAYQKLDSRADLFFLSLQFNYLHKHPEFQGLIRYDAQSTEATYLKDLSAEVMRPPDPKNPTITTARQLLERIQEIQDEIGMKSLSGSGTG